MEKLDLDDDQALHTTEHLTCMIVVSGSRCLRPHLRRRTWGMTESASSPGVVGHAPLEGEVVVNIGSWKPRGGVKILVAWAGNPRESKCILPPRDIWYTLEFPLPQQPQKKNVQKGPHPKQSQNIHPFDHSCHVQATVKAPPRFDKPRRRRRSSRHQHAKRLTQGAGRGCIFACFLAHFQIFQKVIIFAFFFLRFFNTDFVPRFLGGGCEGLNVSRARLCGLANFHTNSICSPLMFGAESKIFSKTLPISMPCQGDPRGEVCPSQFPVPLPFCDSTKKRWASSQ